jgi:hypothetical protein
MLACYEKIPKETKRCLSHQILVLDFFSSYSATFASPSVLLDAGNDEDGPPTIQNEVPYP